MASMSNFLVCEFYSVILALFFFSLSFIATISPLQGVSSMVFQKNRKIRNSSLKKYMQENSELSFKKIRIRQENHYYLMYKRQLPHPAFDKKKSFISFHFIFFFGSIFVLFCVLFVSFFFTLFLLLSQSLLLSKSSKPNKHMRVPSLH